MNPDDDKIDYALELAKHQGISVSTVKDGWVFMFSENTLKVLLQEAKASGQVAVFVKSSENAAAIVPGNAN